MTKEDRLKEVKDRYESLKESGKLNQRHRSSNPLNAFNFDLATQVIKDHMKDGKTVVPIDLKDFWTQSGVEMDFNHARDKARRYFEIVMLNQLYPEEMNQINGIYGSKTTEVLRKHFNPAVNFKMESNTTDEICFLSIDVSNIQVE